MSKAIETLRRYPSKDDILHEQIVDTYFSQKNRKKKARSGPQKIKVNFAATASFAAILFVIAVSPHAYQYHLNSLKKQIDNLDRVNIIDAGRIDKRVIKRMTFRGYAKQGSRFANGLIILNNGRKYNWADFSLDFKFPVDLSARRLEVTTKGTVGGERVNIVLRDARNKSSRLRDVYLVPDWKTDVISLDGAKKDLDISRITHIRMEYGNIGESASQMDSPIDVKAYLKDFHIIKEGLS